MELSKGAIRPFVIRFLVEYPKGTNLIKADNSLELRSCCGSPMLARIVMVVIKPILGIERR
jgi:hypothetical protein